MDIYGSNEHANDSFYTIIKVVSLNINLDPNMPLVRENSS